MSSTWISSPDIAQFGNSDHVLANSAASTTNVPFLELSLYREPGALEEAPVLTSTISLSTLHSDKPENIKSMAQILPFVAESVEDSTNHSVSTPSHSRCPFPLCQHLLPH